MPSSLGYVIGYFKCYSVGADHVPEAEGLRECDPRRDCLTGIYETVSYVCKRVVVTLDI